MPARRQTPEVGWIRGSVPVRTLGPKGNRLGVVPYPLEKVASASEDAGIRKGVDCEIPHKLERRQNILYKDVKTSP